MMDFSLIDWPAISFGLGFLAPLFIYATGGARPNSTANRLARSSGASFLDSLLSDNGTNVTLVSGQLIIPAGSASAPSFRESASQTGIYFSGSTMQFTDAGGGSRSIAHWSSGVRFANDGVVSWSSGTDAAGSGADLLALRDAAGIMRLEGASSGPAEVRVRGDSNGSLVNIRQDTELTTIAAAATTDTTITFPANSLALGVSVRVTTAIPTAATFDVGVAGATTRYGSGISTAGDTTNASPGTTNPSVYGAATAIRITPNLTPADNTGRVRVTIYYIDLTASTS